jgi:KAP family P-loop domain/Double zinc ribbon
MRITPTSRYRWLPVRIDDFEKWQSGLLDESARRLGALLDPGGRVHRWGFVGSPVMFQGQRAWLRVSPFPGGPGTSGRPSWLASDWREIIGQCGCKRGWAGVAKKKILLDTPTGQPTLGYSAIAAAFAGVIADSEPNFAIGVFGGWGSGKTTLMRAIERALPTDRVVTAEFNAWRFEREPQLLVPLLDVIRGVLSNRAERTVSLAGPRANAGTADRLRQIVERLGRVVRALASGLSASAGLPGAVTVSYDAKPAMDALDALSTGPGSLGPKSLYVAAFQELRSAFADLGQAGISRIVVFVDDLDRCLPGNALEVLESMKLFFDLPGLVFVVGLDETVIDRAIQAKYSAAGSYGSSGIIDGSGPTKADSLSGVGREYAKKIFQIPYTLPVMLPEQLDDLLDSMYVEARIEDDQLKDLRERVRPYLEVIAVQRRVNPREVKRFINSYTMQTLIRPDLIPEVILALQTLTFRPDWQEVYDAVIANPNHFGKTLAAYRDGADEKFRENFPGLPELSADLKEFLTSALLQPVVDEPDLDPYLSSLRSTSGPEQMRLDLNNWLEDLQVTIKEARVKGRGIEGVSAAAFCGACGAERRSGAWFCPKCGREFAALEPLTQLDICRACGAELKADIRFCGTCGHGVVVPELLIEYDIDSIIQAIQLFHIRLDPMPMTQPGPIHDLGGGAQSKVTRIFEINEILRQTNTKQDQRAVAACMDEIKNLIKDLESLA